MLDDISLNVPAATPLSRSLSKSTPRDPTLKLHPLPKPPPVCRTEDDISVQSHSQVDDQSIWPTEDVTTNPAASTSASQAPNSNLEYLPSEILELIAGYVVGHLGSASTGTVGSDNVIKNWNEIMRHPRRRNVADLALVSPTWRRLIQERLFRHIKIQGTVAAQEQCNDFFINNPHLRQYVRHLQIIVPIWETKQKPSSTGSTPEPPYPTRGLLYHSFQTLLPSTNGATTPPLVETNQLFQLASKNATVNEMFGTARDLFPDICAITIEAGHCKRPPQVKYFRRSPPRRSVSPISSAYSLIGLSDTSKNPEDIHFALTKLPRVKTLILKGAWNIIRTPADFLLLAKALPNLEEFHCNHHAFKKDAYMTMCTTLRDNLASNITHLNIGLDGLYTKHLTSLRKWGEIYPHWHVCSNLGRKIPQLESLTFTGRVCSELFATAAQVAPAQELSSNINNRLKSIDLIVNNVCCDPLLHNDATGIQHYPFIEAFEALIVSVVRALTIYTALNQIRIRFIDLDSPALLLNPMFHLERGRAWGFWSEEIVTLMRQARPHVKFLGLRGQLGTLLAHEEQEEPKRSLSVEYYRAMAHGGVLIH